MSEHSPDSSVSGLVWLAALALLLIGGGSAIAAMTAVGDKDFVGGGVCAIASALSFGAILTSILRR